MNPSEIPDDVAVLARLMDVAMEDETLWRPDELAAVLRHQLAAPLEFPPDPLDGRPEDWVQAACAAATPAIRCFGDLFAHPRPPLELLRKTKDYAKVCRTRGDGAVPAEIATLLYVLSIVTARSAHGERISELNDQSLGHVAAWAVGQPWVDETTRDLLRRAPAVFGLEPSSNA